MYSYGKTTPPPPQEPLPQGDQPPRGRGLKNPAVRSMITLLGYVVLLIAMWALLGKLLFPTQSTREKLANLVAQNRNLLIQLAESADDPALLTSLESTETVRDLFEAGDIRAVARRRWARALRARRRGRRRRGAGLHCRRPVCAARRGRLAARRGRRGTACCAGRKRVARPSRSRGWRRASFSSSGVRRMREACFSKSSFTARAEWIIMGT